MEIYNHDPKIYLIGGKARSGKSTVAKYIKEIYENKGKKGAVLSHSKYIKDYVKEYFGWDGKEETKPRELLQNLGTLIIRKKLHDKFFFINRVTEDIEILSYFFDVLIVNDARLKVEIDTQKELFDKVIAIGITRDNYDNGLTEEQKQDITEKDLEDYKKFDYTIANDGTLEDLRNKVLEIINQEEVF